MTSNPNFICWHPFGKKMKRYMHYFHRYRTLKRFVSWTVNGRGFTLSNFTNWHESIKRNFYWLSQDNHWPKFIGWPTREVQDDGEVVYELATLLPQHLPLGTEPMSSFKPQLYDWKYYDDPNYEWFWAGGKKNKFPIV